MNNWKIKFEKHFNKLDLLWLRRAVMIMIMDAIVIFVTYFIALWVRFDFSIQAIPAHYLEGFTSSIGYWILIYIVIFYIFSLYHSIWRFVSVNEFARILGAYGVIAIYNILYILITKLTMPRSYYLIGLILSFLFTVAIRFSYRFIKHFDFFRKSHKSTNIMIIGAGEAGRAILKEISYNNKLSAKVCCFIDDNRYKHGASIDGVTVVGGREKIQEMATNYDIEKIIYAIPSAKGSDKKEILSICNSTGCDVQLIPSVGQLVTGEVSIKSMRRVAIHDLLGRDPIIVNSEEILDFISGKVILVTGGGGSIGSELCRQIAKAGPELLIIFDIYENNAYEIQNELRRDYPQLNLEVLIGSVRNTARLDDVFKTYHPQIIFHAAAHKHVPLMEDSPNEAIKNNVFGTYKMSLAAAKYGVKRFVLISTDKAVNPTNIMGASKRLCEMVVQMMNRKSDTEFVAVRFGNVLGSNGSVVPLFKKQIEQGGPITITHPDIIRYFMTIPEAVSLVLQAGYYAKGGEIFVLDMGEPVKIVDMARNLIKLSGFEPDVDIKIVYTGLRPGEKLFEELLMDEEGLKGTSNKMIKIGRPIEMDDDLFLQQLELLEKAYKEESHDMKTLVAKIVPTYKPSLNFEEKK